MFTAALIPILELQVTVRIKLCHGKTETTVLMIVTPRNKLSMAQMQKCGSLMPVRLFTIVLLLASACFLLAADKKDTAASSASAPDKTSAHPYNYPFGASPFLPSQAKTASPGFVSASAFVSAKFCANCHEDVHQQWRQSAHANSFRGSVL